MTMRWLFAQSGITTVSRGESELGCSKLVFSGGGWEQGGEVSVAARSGYPG